MPNEHDKCPKCGGELEYDEVDIGVGVMRGNPGCPACYWMPPSTYDVCKTSPATSTNPALPSEKKCP